MRLIIPKVPSINKNYKFVRRYKRKLLRNHLNIYFNCMFMYAPMCNLIFFAKMCIYFGNLYEYLSWDVQ